MVDVRGDDLKISIYEENILKIVSYKHTCIITMYKDLKID